MNGTDSDAPVAYLKQYGVKLKKYLVAPKPNTASKPKKRLE